MTASKLGTPVEIWTSLYGRSPQRPTAYSNVFLFVSPLPPTASPVVIAAATTTASISKDRLRVPIRLPLSPAVSDGERR